MSGLRAPRRLALLAWTVTMLLLLAACAPEPVAGWAPRTWHTHGSVGAALPDIATPEATPMINMRILNDAVGIDARWAYLPSVEAFNDLVETTVRDAVRTQSEANGTPYHPMAHASGAGLNDRGCQVGSSKLPPSDVMSGRTGTVIVCEIVLARGPVIGERLRALTATRDGIIVDTVTTVYADTATGEVATQQDLFTDPAAIWAAYIDVLRRALDSLSIAPIAPPTDEQLTVLRRALDSADLVDGDLVIPVPAGLHADELDGLAAWKDRLQSQPQYVTLAATDLEAALSPLARTIATSHGVFAGQATASAGARPTPCDLVPCMALTLDDGPSPLTPGFLDVLHDQQSTATFFMLGQNAQAYPDIVRRVAAEGHEIGNHTWSHPYLTELTADQIRSQLNRTATLLRELSGQPVNIFRPPGGFINGAVVAAAGQPAILWTIDTRDWTHPADEALARTAIDQPDVSTILLMHDIQAGSSRVFAQVVAGLRDRGFSLVTIQNLFNDTVPAGIVRRGPLP